MEDAELLAEQVDYYRARAPRYDDWWQRRGPYDRGPAMEQEWDRQLAEVERALADFSLGGDVLELAGGTGWWTERLTRGAQTLTVVDSSPEALERNRARTGRSDIDYVVADVFSWRASRTYDVVFFSFRLSHVPRRRSAAFWSLVRSCLSPGGRVFLIDNHNDPVQSTDSPDPYVLRYEPDRHVRRVDDGRRYNVVKVMYRPEELQAHLYDLGWTAEITATPWFLFGSARPG